MSSVQLWQGTDLSQRTLQVLVVLRGQDPSGFTPKFLIYRVIKNNLADC